MIEFLDFLPYAISAVAPLTLYILACKYLARREHTELLASDNLPRPRQVPSDYVIYRYDAEGRVSSRWVYAREDTAITCTMEEKAAGEVGRLFKDGVMLWEW
ncbi:MAG: hypothetical protein V3S55_09955 [Nitrospiraceae bacterium]